MKKQKTKLRIAVIGYKFIPSREGGIEVVVEELAVWMVALGNDVTCYNRKNKKVGKGKNDRKYKQIFLKSVPTINCKGLAAITSSVFASIFASFGRYDFVHYHAEGPSIMCWLPKLFRKRIVVTNHGLQAMNKRLKYGFFCM
ncbi:glycosyltransferase family 4 protein [[Clostridium] innocuum]|nr:glycosyltransferase family 4 protein [[Clostridium] innocuum]